jgi:hypothetical protein
MERNLPRIRPANFADCPATVDAAAVAPTASNPTDSIGPSGIAMELEKNGIETPEGYEINVLNCASDVSQVPA